MDCCQTLDCFTFIEAQIRYFVSEVYKLVVQIRLRAIADICKLYSIPLITNVVPVTLICLWIDLNE